jgi:hypothetical protein
MASRVRIKASRELSDRRIQREKDETAVAYAPGSPALSGPRMMSGGHITLKSKEN